MDLSAIEAEADSTPQHHAVVSATMAAGKTQRRSFPTSRYPSPLRRRLPGTQNGLSPMALLGKRIFDLVTSATLLICLAPLFAVVACVIGRSGEPVLFAQTRIGRNGQPFTCYKFRSMVTDAEQVLETLLHACPDLRAEWEFSQKLKIDPRITPIGAFIRRTSIDELPQLWNVLRGEMSLVGPRPALESQYAAYGRSQKWYRAMKPGITGLWQVTARGDGSFERRKALDCYYVRNYRFHHDFIILLKTIQVVLSGRGAF